MVSFSFYLTVEADGGGRVQEKRHLKQWSSSRLLPVSKAREGQRAQELYEKESESSLSKRVPRGT